MSHAVMHYRKDDMLCRGRDKNLVKLLIIQFCSSIQDAVFQYELVPISQISSDFRELTDCLRPRWSLTTNYQIFKSGNDWITVLTLHPVCCLQCRRLQSVFRYLRCCIRFHCLSKQYCFRERSLFSGYLRGMPDCLQNIWVYDGLYFWRLGQSRECISIFVQLATPVLQCKIVI